MGPYVLDARRRISYLTIEYLKGFVPLYLRPLIGNHIFGCDICQEIWVRQRKGSPNHGKGKAPQGAGLHAPDLIPLLSLDEEEFRRFVSAAA